MKKYLLTLLIIITFIVPSITFASWWNPFSWNVWSNLFNRKVIDPQIQIINQPIDTNSVNKPIIITPVTNEVKKDVPVIDNLIIQKKEAQAKLEAELRAKVEQEALILKQKAEEQTRIESELKAKAEQEALLKPSITNITITDISYSSVKISWETSVISESKVLFDGNQYVSKSGVGTKHYVVLSNLSGDTDYSGDITAISDNFWENKNFQFTTDPMPDICPNISGIQTTVPIRMILDDGDCITPKIPIGGGSVSA